MVTLTTPSDVDHQFGFNKVDKPESYTMPISGQYRYEYDADRRLTAVVMPSGQRIEQDWVLGRMAQVRTPEATIDLDYLCSSKVGSMTNGNETIAFGYDGPLATQVNATGTLNATIALAYNNDFKPTQVEYAGAAEALSYDNDGLLTGSGLYAIARDAGNGLPTAVAGSALGLTRGFNGYGEMDAQNATVGGADVWRMRLARDDSGRITQKTEVLGGNTTTWTYQYDDLGRVTNVWKDGALVEQYGYGASGARTSEMNALRGIASREMSYSDEDHLLTAGNATCHYDFDGFLLRKATSAGDTWYDYSTRGELLRVDLPDGRAIEYTTDPLGRRIAKKIDGVIVEKYLWQGLTRLLAVYDGAGALLQCFEYADGRMPVAMTRAGARYYLAYDQVGSLRAVMDGAGNVVKRVDYDSFGNTLFASDADFAVPFGFAGGLYDSDTELTRFGYRDYDADTGRWTAKDPIGFKGGDVDLYEYCLNSPVFHFDILGFYAGVQIWDGAGYGHSAFGHMAININGTVYSFGPNGMFITSLEDYLTRNKFRDGTELMLSLTPCQEQKLKDFLESFSEEYSFPSLTCLSPILYGLYSIGVNPGFYLTPRGAMFGIMDSTVSVGYNIMIKSSLNISRRATIAILILVFIVFFFYMYHYYGPLNVPIVLKSNAKLLATPCCNNDGAMQSVISHLNEGEHVVVKGIVVCKNFMYQIVDTSSGHGCIEYSDLVTDYIEPQCDPLSKLILNK